MAAIRKDRIKDQMLKTAARLWSIPENEIETTFDPLILLMMEACAAELEKIGHDINASHERMLDKLANLILPEAMLGARPASCIMHATPTEPGVNINPLVRFYATLRQTGGNTGGAAQSQDIFFTPIGDFTLHKASLAYTLIGSKLFKISEHGARELLSVSGAASDLTEEIWLAILPDKDVRSLRGLSLFFDLRGHSEADSFYKSLETAQGWIRGQDAALKTGYYNPGQFELALQDLLASGNDYTKKIARDVAGVWNRRFLHIDSDLPVSSMLSSAVPDAWRSRINADAIKPLEAQPMIYLRIRPGRIFHQEVLETAGISINAFPAVNRRLHTLNYRTDAWINIIPIRVESSFLDLHSITGTGGGYRFRISSGAQEMEEGEALIRSTGVGKTDSREVREIIASLMEAIRDESAFFSELNNEFIQGRLREISQILARLEDQVDRAKDNQASYQYLLLRPYKAGEQLTINYWTTNGPDAHAVKAGTALAPFNHTLVSAKECYMLTNMFGGGVAPSPVQKRNMLKQQLHSRGKIVSAEDVRLLCLQLFGERLKKVEVRKGVQIGAGAREGFSRSIDVLLTLTPESTDYGRAEVDYLRNELENTLQQVASPVYPFRILTV